MAIPDSQLEMWAKPGSQAKYKDAHESIRKTLDAYDWSNGKPDYEVYLQGSYKNSTTTRNNSDVDVVVQLNSAYSQDLSNLSDADKRFLSQFQLNSISQWEHFRYDVITALKSNKSFDVSNGNKCIYVKTPYLDADVVVCMQHRLYVKRTVAWNYHQYTKSKNRYYLEGIKFKSNDGIWIINYPKYHDKNGTLKSQYTSGRHNTIVRIFKNIKLHLIEKNIITKEEVPSYFIECLLYNVPPSIFEPLNGKTIYNILFYLNNQNIKHFKCQNGITNLFGDSPDQWSVNNARNFINKSIELWNNW